MADQVGEARESIRSITRDPVIKLLLGNSMLTLPQLETILADSFAKENGVKKDDRRLLRTSGTRISRGAFNRTLIQAQNNLIRSIFTVLLLGYIGFFDSTSLQPFLELSDTVQGYVQDARQTAPQDRAGLEHLNRRLLEGISALASRQSFKDLL